MSKEIQKFVKDYKTKSTRMKALTVQQGTKLKKTMLTNLEKTWAAEDLLQEAVLRARTAGVAGKKSAPFMKHAEVTKPYKTWLAALKIYHADLDAFTAFNKEARELGQQLTKELAVVEKEVKKSGAKPDKPTQAVLTEAKRALPDLKKAQELMGKCKAFEVMYGLKLQRTIDAIVKQAVESVEPKTFPEPLAEKNRKGTEKALKDFEKKIVKCNLDGQKALKDGKPDDCKTQLESAQKMLDVLEGFNKEAKLAGTKMKEEIKAENVKRLVDAMQAVYKRMAIRVKRLEDDYKKHLSKAK